MYYYSSGNRIEGRYLVSDVKKGGMGIVYICHDELYDMPIALKTFQFESTQNWKFILGSFVREAKIWVSIGYDMNVVQAYYVINVEKDRRIIPYLALELVKGHPLYGTSLSGWIRNSALDIELVLLFAAEICSGMVHIQKKLSRTKSDFVHRDLKPQNILISREGSIKITDFGLAKVLQEHVLQIVSIPQSFLTSDGYFTAGFTKAGCGTPPYMSPEQCIGKHRLDQRSDIYSFGCILYEMCTRHFIFQASSPDEFIQKQISAHPIPPRFWNPNIPKPLVSIINQCLQKNPKDRPQSFEEVLNSIMQIIKNKKYRLLQFIMFGFSGFTNKPRVKSDWGMDEFNEALLLGKSYGIDYIIKQGLVSCKDEFDEIVKEYEISNEGRRKVREQKKSIEDAYELVATGDSLFLLAEAVETHERTKLIRSALSKYQFAHQLTPTDPRISFRLGMAYSDLANLVRKGNKSLSEDLIKIAIVEHESVLMQEMTPTLDVIGSIYYLLPFHALYYKAAALTIRGDLESAAKDFKALLFWLQRCDLSKFPDSSEQLKQNTTKVLQLVLRRMTKG